MLSQMLQGCCYTDKAAALFLFVDISICIIVLNIFILIHKLWAKSSHIFIKFGWAIKGQIKLLYRLSVTIAVGYTLQ